METKIALKKEFELIESIGRGLSSEVYKGLRLDSTSEFSEIVAIKIFKSSKFRKKYQNELKNLSKINHPNVVAVKDWGQIEDRFFLVTEYIYGQDLLNIIKLLDPKDKNLKKHILNQIYDGLKVLKNKGIAHGDLKPSNVMISIKGELKLIDISFDDLGQVFATPDFTAPEVLSGLNANFEADLFSLGVISQKMDLWQKKLMALEPGDRHYEPFKGVDGFVERDKLSALVRKSFLLLENTNTKFEFTQELNATPKIYSKVIKNPKSLVKYLKQSYIHIVLALVLGAGFQPEFPIVKKLKLRSSKAYEYWNEKAWVTLPVDTNIYFADSVKAKKLKFRSHKKEINLHVRANMDFSKNIVIDAL